MESTASAIRTRALSRLFPGGQGVRDLALDVPAGSIYGFLGPNGAGKTTTIRLLLGLLRPAEGSIELFGQALDQRRQALRQVGALVESPSLYGHLSGRDNLEVTRRLLGAAPARIDWALERVDLAGAAHRRGARILAGHAPAPGDRPGAARRAAPADPRRTRERPGTPPASSTCAGCCAAWPRKASPSSSSSHLLSEVELVASHVGVLHEGRLRFQGHLQQLRARVRPRLHLRCEPALRAAEILTRAGEFPKLGMDGSLTLELHHRDAAEINRLLVEHGVAVSQLQQRAALAGIAVLRLTVRPRWSRRHERLARALSPKRSSSRARWRCGCA
jgi:ABC-2 type transport system ATP-binding protein